MWSRWICLHGSAAAATASLGQRQASHEMKTAIPNDCSLAPARASQSVVAYRHHSRASSPSVLT